MPTLFLQEELKPNTMEVEDDVMMARVNDNTGLVVDPRRYNNSLPVIVIAAMITGALVGLLLPTVTTHLGFNPMKHFWGAMLTLVCIPLVAVLLVREARHLSQKAVDNKVLYSGYPRSPHRPRLPWLFLYLVALLTEFMPCLGPVFGGTGSWDEVPIVTMLGAVGGLLWGLLLGGLKRVCDAGLTYV